MIADYLPWILIAVIVLGIIMIAIFVLQDTGTSLVDKFKNLLKWS